MKEASPVGRYETVLLNGEKIVLPGNSKPVIFAGLSMEPFVRVGYRKTGVKR